MSGNNSFNKSMNGIVSLDTGGTTIEGGDISADLVDCNTINATTANISSTINTSIIYTDNIYTDNIYSNLTTSVNINNSLKTTRLDSINPTSGYSLLTNHTAALNMGGSASVIRLGSATTPVRTLFVPVGGDDLCNKDYVDSAVSGGSLLSTTNIWTGASNTFNNILNVSTTTIFGKASMAFTGGNDYNIVSADINNIFMVVVNGGNPRVIQMPARKIGQIIIIRSIANPGVGNQISVSLISGGNFYNPGQSSTALFYSLPSGGTVSYLDNGQNWISF
jgi:hypothetical protein